MPRLMPTRIQSLFERTKNEHRAALIAYLTAGDPTPERTPGIVAALERGGVDLIELGVPFSEPIADGPVIQRGAERALRAGTNVKKVLEIARQIRKHLADSDSAVHVLEPGAALRPGKTARGCESRRHRRLPADGFERRRSRKLRGCDARGRPRHGFPGRADFHGSPPGAGREILHWLRLSGFAHRRHGRTQPRCAKRSSRLIERTRTVTPLPLAAGFGISTPEQAGIVAKMADGVVVGSAIVRLIENNASDVELESFAHSLRDKLSWRA